MNNIDLRAILESHLYSMGEALMEYYNPCDIRDGICRAGDATLCCTNSVFGDGLCPHWKDTKCTHPNSNCKLWICDTANKATDKEGVTALWILQQFAQRYGLTHSPLIGLPYSGADKQP